MQVALTINGIQDWMRSFYGRKKLLGIDETTYDNNKVGPKIDFTSSLVSVLKYRKIIFGNATYDTLQFLIDGKDDIIIPIFNRLGLDRYRGTIGEFIDFLYYYIYGDMSALTINQQIMSYVSGLSNNELFGILKPFGYRGPIYKPAMTFAVLTCSTSYLFIRNEGVQLNTERYNQILYQTPSAVWKLFNSYKTNQPSFFGPYLSLSHFPERKMERYLILLHQCVLNNNRILLQRVFDKLGLLSPFDENTHIEELDDYIVDNINIISPILNRKPNMEDPPEIMGMSDRQGFIFLVDYTDVELKRFYDILDLPYKRMARIAEIVINSRRKMWSNINRICSNGNLEDISELVPRNNLPEHERNNLLSYGTPRNHACYSVEELNLSFGTTPEVEFRFFNPDNDPNNRPLPDFPLYSMRQLRILLQDSFDNNGSKEVKELIDKIDLGIKLLNDADLKLSSYKNDYLSMTPEEQNLVINYFVWLFIFGMYSRYWKGPGYEWPNLFKYIDETCTQEQRGLTSQINSISFQDDIIQPSKKYMLKNGETLYNWFINLPRIRYNWSSGDITIGVLTVDPSTVSFENRKDLIYPILLITFKGNYCQSATADMAIQSSYVYLTKVIGLSLQQFNQVIKNYIKRQDQEDFNPIQFKETGHELAVIGGEGQLDFE